MGKKSRKKTDLPVYTIKTFQRSPGSVHFEMGTMEESVGRFNFASTPHRHDCFFIMFVTRGSGTHTIDTQEYPIKRFACFLMLPGQVHSWSFSDDIKGFYFHFTLEFYKSYVRERHIEKFPYLRMLTLDSYVQFDPKIEQGLEAMITDMYAEFNARKIGWEDILRNSLDSLIIRMARYSRSDVNIQGTLSTVTHIRSLQTLIERHFHELKLPSDYAKMMNVTPKHLNALCKSSLNKTVTELIQERTIVEAKRHLAYTEKTIKQIATELGFSDLSYFMRYFKKQTKNTPDQFRKSVGYVPSVEVEGVL